MSPPNFTHTHREKNLIAYGALAHSDLIEPKFSSPEIVSELFHQGISKNRGKRKTKGPGHCTVDNTEKPWNLPYNEQ